MTTKRKGITRKIIPEGYSYRKYKHVPEYEYEQEYNDNLQAYIRSLQDSGYNVTAPRVRASVNKRHGYPLEKRPGKERTPTAWNAYTKEKLPQLMEQGHNFRDAMRLVSDQWKIDKEFYVALHELRQLKVG